jgi:outer membrane protein
MRIRMILFLAIFLTVPGIVTAQNDLLTLEDAIAIALENNRTVKNANLEIEKALEQIAVAKTRRLPSFNSYALTSRQLSHTELRFDRGSLGVLDGIGPVPAQDTTIRSSGRFSTLFVSEISQPLSQLHRIGLGIKSAEIGAGIQLQQRRAAEQSVTASVKQAYYAILQTQSSLRAIEESVRLYKELDRVTEQYVLQRVALKSEGLEVKTRLARTELDVLTVQDRLESQKEQLNALLGRDLDSAFSVVGFTGLEAVNVALPQAQAIAMAQRPEIKQAKLKLQQAEVDRRVKRSEFIPEVSLNVSHTSPINYSDVLPKNFSTIGVAVNWEVFDWGRKKHEVSAKDHAILQATNTLRDAESTVVREVNANHRALQRSAQIVRIATLSQETAAESLRVVANGYKVSAALLKDVLQSEAAVAQANDQYEQALLAFWTAKSEFDKSLGEDHD